jgi:hypothetical protein
MNKKIQLNLHKKPRADSMLFKPCLVKQKLPVQFYIPVLDLNRL